MVISYDFINILAFYAKMRVNLFEIYGFGYILSSD